MAEWKVPVRKTMNAHSAFLSVIFLGVSRKFPKLIYLQQTVHISSSDTNELLVLEE